MAHVYRGRDSRENRNLILYGMARCYAARVQEWYYPPSELSRLSVPTRNCQGGPLILTRSGIHKTKAGSCKLSQLAAQSFFGRILVVFYTLYDTRFYA